MQWLEWRQIVLPLPPINLIKEFLNHKLEDQTKGAVSKGSPFFVLSEELSEFCQRKNRENKKQGY